MNGLFGGEAWIEEEFFMQNKDTPMYPFNENFLSKDMVEISEAAYIIENWENTGSADLLFSQGGFNTNERDNDISILEIIAKSVAKYSGKFPVQNYYTVELNRKLSILYDYPQSGDFEEIMLSGAVRELSKSKILKYFIIEILSIVEAYDFRSLIYQKRANQPTFNFGPVVNIEKLHSSIPKLTTGNIKQLIAILLNESKTKYTFHRDSHALYRGLAMINEYEYEVLVDINLIWNLYLHCQPDNRKDTAITFVTKLQKNYPLYLNGYRTVCLTHPSMKIDNSEHKYIIPEKLLNYQRLAAELTPKQLDEFNFLYKKYLRGLESCLSFTKCASKLTRVNKLYKKPLIFELQEKNSLNPFSKFNADERFVKQRDGHKCQYCGSRDDLEIDQIIPRIHGGLNQKTNWITSCKKCNRNYGSDYSKKFTDLSNDIILKIITDVTKQKYTSPEFLQFLNKYLGVSNLDKSLKNHLKKGLKKLTVLGDNFAMEAVNETHIIALDDTTYLEHHLDSGLGIKPLIISGDAGMGKTVSITQFSLNYITKLNQLVEQNSFEQLNHIPLPLFIRAKRIELNDKIINNINLVFESLPQLKRHISRDDFANLYSYWTALQDCHNSSKLYFIDGLDECVSQVKAAKILSELIHPPPGLRRKPNLVLSTRPAYYGVVKKALSSYGLLELISDRNYYSDYELSHEMPMKLCDAWGITREAGKELGEKFDSYRSTLIHPLFVGWFCFLILDNKLEQIEQDSVKPVFVKYNLLSHIIDIGIDSSLERRGVKRLVNKTMSNDKFKDILKSFVATSWHFGIDDPKKVFQRMEQIGIAEKLPEEVKKSLVEDCGILFLASSKIEWSHPTIREIMYADFFLNTDWYIQFGPLRKSDPVDERLAQLLYERNDNITDYKQAHLYTYYNYTTPLEFNKEVGEALINIDPYGNEVALIGLDKNGLKVLPKKGLQPEHYIGSLYLQSLNTRKKFPIGVDRLDEKYRSQIISIIYNASRDPFGLDLLIPFTNENVISADTISPYKVNKATRVVDCFRYYRNLIYEDNKIPPDSEFLTIHKIAGNFADIFDVNYANGMMQQSASIYSNAENWLDKSEDALFNDDLVQKIVEEYVWTAYGKLFGDDIDEECIDVLWDNLHKETVYQEIGFSESLELVEINFITMLMANHGLNNLIDINHGGAAEILERFDTSDSVVRGLFLMPFINQCIKKRDGITTKSTEFFNDFIAKYGYWKPYEMVLNYLPNLGG